jgi:hypothetical protein
MEDQLALFIRWRIFFSSFLLRKSLPTDERFQRMEDQLALFIRWRIFFSSFLGVAQRHEQLLRKYPWERRPLACSLVG